MTATLQEAIAAVRAGDAERAQLLAADVIRRDPDDARAWYLLSQLVDSDARRAAYLRKTLTIDPGHARAQAELDELSPGLFDTQPLAAALLVGVPAAETADSVLTPPVEWAGEELAAPTWEQPLEADVPTTAGVETALAAEPLAAPIWEELPAPETPAEAAYAPAGEAHVAVEMTAAPVEPVAVTSAPPVPPSAAPALIEPARQPAQRPKRGNQGLTLLLGVLVFLTLIVLAFLVYLLFFA